MENNIGNASLPAASPTTEETPNQTTSEKKSSSEITHDFASESTFHGIKYVTDPKHSIFRRFIWTLIILGALVWLGFNVTMSFKQFFQFPKSTLVTVKHVPDLNFPAVTLCNFNQLRKSKLDEKTLSLMQAVFGIEALETGRSVNWTEFQQLLSDDSQWLDLINNSTHQIRDMVVACTWRGFKNAISNPL
ncbi:acid-sensing ion channel 1C-like [Amphiura filiformis]|uniref:acid-sensing ion channel 1C-like n=1 Tax=Amphiura filiformis TaxID=82378 RepID=UPI003B215BA7